MEEAKKELIHCDDKILDNLSDYRASELAEKLSIIDNGFQSLRDLKDRLILNKRKMQNSGHKPFRQFSRVQADVATKRRNLQDILQSVTKIFQKERDDFTRTPLIDALSEILLRQRLLSKHNLLDELADRMKALEAKETLIVVAGETNSGKSTFLNVLLGQNILPTDILHCTYVVCKIVYSHSYIVETLDYEDHCEEYYCDDFDQAKEKLKEVAACEDCHSREQTSFLREITLKIPAEILKSGITLVDTPGIGENGVMDTVTINYIREAQASAFIYIIKSDVAGGVQEDRLLAFLRAIKDHYKDTHPEGTFDPQAAMFICHRWDTINKSEAEKVEKNTLNKLEMVWPSFQPSQTYMFSSKKAKLHLDIDPDFITDSFNSLLNGLKQLIDKATHNAIKYQYCWMNHFLASSRQHLRAMIMNCTTRREDLDDHFADVEEKMGRLMKAANEQIPLLQKNIDDQKIKLSLKLKQILSLSETILSSELEDYSLVLSACKEDRFLLSGDNPKRVDQQIVICLVKYCDEYLQRENILKSIEECIFQEIKDHIGLFEDQLQQIKNDIQGTDRRPRRDGSVSSGSSVSRMSHNGSFMSDLSINSDTDDCEESHIPDPIKLKQEVDNLIRKRKAGMSFKKGWKSGVKVLKNAIKGENIGHLGKDPKEYLDSRIRKLAAKMIDDQCFLDSLVSRYLQFLYGCMKHAINCIPHFITVNTKLMSKICEHQEAFLEDKLYLKDVMEKINHCCALLNGYGHSYMEDVDFDKINLALGRQKSTVELQLGAMLASRPDDDSGFIEGQITKRKVRTFWAHYFNAELRQHSSVKKVTIKTYSFIQGEAEHYAEISALRCLNHENVASYLGMTRLEASYANDNTINTVPSFIFEGCLRTGRIYMGARLSNLKEFVPNFLCQIWQGLDYIHKEALVHPELNLDTVMVDSQSGIVKLCQQCYPRMIQLPTDLSLKTKAAVCLSPNVLRGNKYQVTDDIYAFGLLLWELLHPYNPPFEEQRQWSLQKFIEEIDPSLMLKSHLDSLNSSSAVKSIIEECVMGVGGVIFNVQSLKNEIEYDPAVATLVNLPLQSLQKFSGLNSSLNSDSDEPQNNSMERENTGNVPSVLSSSRRSKHSSDVREFFSSIPEERLNGDAAETFPTPKFLPKRRQRHSHIVAPSLSQLDIPTPERQRKISLPNMPQMSSNEKCQRFHLMSNRPYTDNVLMAQDSVDAPSCKNDPVYNLNRRRSSAGSLPRRTIKTPGSTHSSQSFDSQKDSELSIELITNKYRSPLRRSLDTGLNNLQCLSAHFRHGELDELFGSRHFVTQRHTDKAHSVFEYHPRNHELSNSKGSSTNLEADPAIQNQSYPSADLNHSERYPSRKELKRHPAFKGAYSTQRQGTVTFEDNNMEIDASMNLSAAIEGKPRSSTISNLEDLAHFKQLPHEIATVSEHKNKQRGLGDTKADLNSSSESSYSYFSDEAPFFSNRRKDSKPVNSFFISSSPDSSAKGSLCHLDSLSSSQNPHDPWTPRKLDEIETTENNTASFTDNAEGLLPNPLSRQTLSTTTTATGHDDSHKELTIKDVSHIDDDDVSIL